MSLLLKFSHCRSMSLFSRMVRNYVKKTNQGNVPADVIRKAISCVTTAGRSIRSVAEQYGASYFRFK